MAAALDLYDRGYRDGLRQAIEVATKHFARYRLGSEAETAVGLLWDELEENMTRFRKEESGQR